MFSRKKKENKQCKYCGYTWNEQDKRSIISILDLGPFCSVCFDNAMGLNSECKCNDSRSKTTKEA